MNFAARAWWSDVDYRLTSDNMLELLTNLFINKGMPVLIYSENE